MSSKAWDKAVTDVTELVNFRKDEVPAETMAEAVKSVMARLNGKVHNALLNQSEMDFNHEPAPEYKEEAWALPPGEDDTPDTLQLSEVSALGALAPLAEDVCPYCLEKAPSAEFALLSEFCSPEHRELYEAGHRKGHCGLCRHVILYQLGPEAPIVDDAGRIYCNELHRKRKLEDGWDSACVYCDAEIDLVAGEFTPENDNPFSRVFCNQDHKAEYEDMKALWQCHQCGDWCKDAWTARLANTLDTGERFCGEECRWQYLQTRNPNAIGLCRNCLGIVVPAAGEYRKAGLLFCSKSCGDKYYSEAFIIDDGIGSGDSEEISASLTEGDIATLMAGTDDAELITGYGDTEARAEAIAAGINEAIGTEPVAPKRRGRRAVP